jgi:hypothetical protein
MRQIELHELEYEAVLLALGYATGGAMKEGNQPLADSFLWAANAFNRGIPRWRIYEVAADLKPEEVIRKFMKTLQEEK